MVLAPPIIETWDVGARDIGEGRLALSLRQLVSVGAHDALKVSETGGIAKSQYG
ncbi:MAG: hypothetical protein LBC46_05790 [Treponema sp.]|nr:hypothetical protein [Treponema sp.]